MNRFLRLAVPVLLLASTQVLAGTKPGLWEIHVTKTVVDGHDQSAAVAAATDQMQAAMARMSPEQRAQMSAMMGKQGVTLGKQGVIQICITPEMAKRDVPSVDKDHTCEPANVKRDGNRTSYSFSCTVNGHATSGSGELIVNGDSMVTRSDVTTKTEQGTHHIESESQMRFVSPDCGDVKPPAAAMKQKEHDGK